MHDPQNIPAPPAVIKAMCMIPVDLPPDFSFGTHADLHSDSLESAANGLNEHPSSRNRTTHSRFLRAPRRLSNWTKDATTDSTDDTDPGRKMFILISQFPIRVDERLYAVRFGGHFYPWHQ
jgi:hypothetical protein